MIQGFENETQPLNEYELETLIPIMVRCLGRRVGVANAITNTEICRRMRGCGYEINDVRVRKIINYIRVNSLVSCLLATSKGYYVASNIDEVNDYIKSLEGREQAIRIVKEALLEQVHVATL